MTRRGRPHHPPRALAATAASVALALAAARPVAAAPRAQPAAERDEPIVVVDLRPGVDRGDSRATLIAALAGVAGVQPRRDPGLDAALAGELPGEALAAAALARAQQAYGAIDCATAIREATAAVDAYAALQAAGAPVTDLLARGYVYLLLCANGQGATDDAHRAAARLRRLVGDAAPAGVSPAIWDRYPAIDAAANVAMVEITIATAPAGAEVWVDHARLGPAPQTALVAAGLHMVAADDDAATASRQVDVAGGETFTLELSGAPAAWNTIRRQVAAWRSGQAIPDAAALAALLDQLGVRFAVVIAGKSQAEVWSSPGGGEPARRIATATLTAGFDLGAAVVQQIAAWEGDEDTVVLGGPEVVHARRQHPQRWWVYAGILGAVAAATGLILVNEAADDHQRIELTWP